MKRNQITLQFIENGLIILQKEKLNKYKLESINNYTVINKDLFIEEITNIIDINKINNKLLTDNIKIIIDQTNNKLYLSNLKEIFKELSFNKIEFINIVDILKPKDHELIIDISYNSIKIIYKDTIIQSNIYYSKYKSILSIYLKSILKIYNIKYLYIYGNYQFTNKFIEDIEKICKIKTYLYTQPDLIPISLLI